MADRGTALPALSCVVKCLLGWLEAVLSRSGLCYQGAGCVIKERAVLSRSGLCYQGAGCVIKERAVLSRSGLYEANEPPSLQL
jgi:hypothetical protein